MELYEHEIDREILRLVQVSGHIPDEVTIGRNELFRIWKSGSLDIRHLSIQDPYYNKKKQVIYMYNEIVINVK